MQVVETPMRESVAQKSKLMVNQTGKEDELLKHLDSHKSSNETMSGVKIQEKPLSPQSKVEVNIFCKRETEESLCVCRYSVENLGDQQRVPDENCKGIKEAISSMEFKMVYWYEKLSGGISYVLFYMHIIICSMFNLNV